MTVRLPIQIAANSSGIIHGWSTGHPSFYGVRTTDEFFDSLQSAEKSLLAGNLDGVDPTAARVLAAFHGPKGPKVPLSTSTISGCVRPYFSEINSWLAPAHPSCYGGHCYLYHARSIPAKNGNSHRVVAHRAPKVELLVAARLSRQYGLPIRDNQSSDGSLSMSARWRNGQGDRLLAENLGVLSENGYGDIPYLCFSSGYVEVNADTLRDLSSFQGLTVHMTVSGWHSKAENLLRLQEFEKYSQFVANTRLRVVNRKCWADGGVVSDEAGARCEKWLLREIEKRGFASRVIRTPYHSVTPFDGGEIGNLGSRFLAGTAYNNQWQNLFKQGAKDCCSTGKCKSCPTACGASLTDRTNPNVALAAAAYESMSIFELARQKREGCSAYGDYVGRLLAKKAKENYEVLGLSGKADPLAQLEDQFTARIRSLDAPAEQKRRWTNDAHALVHDGLDRYGIWAARRRTARTSKTIRSSSPSTELTKSGKAGR